MTRQGEAMKTRTTNQRPRHARTAAASVGAAALLTVLGVSTKFDCYAASGVIRSTPQAWTTYAIPPGGRITSTKVWVSSKCLPAVAGWETSLGHNAVFETHQKVGSYKGAFVEPKRVVY